MLSNHKPIEDDVIKAKMFELLASVSDNDVALDVWHNDHYVDSLVSWMQDHPLNQLQGVDKFTHRDYSQGSVESIISFVTRHGHCQRIRFSHAEFAAARVVCTAAGYSWCGLEDDPIKPGDAVVISMPFAGTGDPWPGFDDLIAQCNQLDVPVMLDLSYWPISYGVQLNIDQPCVKEVVFSLSKPLATQLRLGLRLSREAVNDMTQINSDLKVYNRVAVWTGIELMDQFSIDWLMSKYLYRQTEICQTLDLKPSMTLTLAQGDPVLHQQFNRNGYNRICITDELSQF